MKHKAHYYLGALAREIYPEAGSMPLELVDYIPIWPSKALGMLRNAMCNLAEINHDRIADIMDRIPADLPERATDEEQSAWWLGYYHYSVNLRQSEEYGAAELQICGEALYGDKWQSELSRELGCDVSALSKPIPPLIWSDIAILVRSAGIYNQVEAQLRDQK